MPIKSSHRLNGYSSRECDNEETVSCKEEEEDEEEVEEEDDEEDDEDDVSEREYLEKLHNLTNQLRQLNEGVHPELCKASKRAENWLSDQRLRIQILHEHKIDEVHCQYEREIKVCEQDCATEKRRIREYLMSLCEDLKKRLEHDKKSIELTPTGDVLELKPAVTRKLRRRTPDTAASCGTKFGYWGDILLYGSSWTLPSVSKALSSSDTAGGGAGQSQPTPAGTPLSPQPPPSTKVAESESGEQNAPPSAAPSSACASGTSNTNLFGSLSVNVEDSSLMTHLLASLNAANDNGGCGGLSSAGAYFASSLNQSGSSFSSLLPATATSGAGVGSSAALAAGAGGAGSSGAVGLGFLSAAPATSAAVLGFPSAAAAALVGAGVGCLQPPKRRKQQTSQPFTQLTLLLPENDIYSDLTAIHRACGKPPVANSAASKKHGGGGGSTSAGCGGLSVDGSPSSRVGGSSPSSCRGGGDSGGRDASGGGDTGSRRKDTNSDACSGAENFSPPSSFSTPSVWIDDGRLYCGQTCFQQGASVHIEGHGCSGTIVSIGAQDVSVKRSSDHGIVRITVQQLKQGRYTLVPKR